MFVHEGLVGPTVREQLVLDRVQERDVRATANPQPDVGLTRRGRWTRVDDYQLRPVGPVQPVEHSHPEHGLGLGDVVPDEEKRVAEVDVGVGARVAVAAEALDQRPLRRRGAKARVAVEVGRAKTRAGDLRLRVVLLREELSACIEAEGERPHLIEQLLRTGHDQLHRLLPRSLPQLAVAANERAR